MADLLVRPGRWPVSALSRPPACRAAVTGSHADHKGKRKFAAVASNDGIAIWDWRNTRDLSSTLGTDMKPKRRRREWLSKYRRIQLS